MANTPGRIYVYTTVRIPGYFRDADGNYVDPDSVMFRTVSPTGVKTTYTFGTDDEIENETTGIYYADIDVDDGTGRWYWRWEVSDTNTITINAAVEGSFVVQSSPHYDAPLTDDYT